MFRSLQRIRSLPDYLQIWPGHGAGSACGRDLGAVPSSTLGYEKLFNWAFNYDDEAAFVKELLRDQPEPPYYFAQMKRLNKVGPPLLNEVDPTERLPLARMADALSGKNPIIDTRSAGDFAARHIPGTLNVPHDSAFINWCGWLIDYDNPYYLIVDPPMAGSLVRDLQGIGLDKCGGYFESTALTTWASAGHEVHCYGSASPSQVAAALNQGEVSVIDVRSQAEWNEGHLPGAQHIMLGYLRERASEVPGDKPVIVQCRTGVRSAIAASILLSSGFSNVTNLMGGFQEWETAGFPVIREPAN
jgi:hydroxyacylglutathione hydrolase